MALTKAQFEVLARAIRYGSAWRCTANHNEPYSPALHRIVDQLRALGLVDRNGKPVDNRG